MTTSQPHRTLPGIRWWDQWISVAIGVLLITWTVSGIVMLLPLSGVAKSGQGTVVAVADGAGPVRRVDRLGRATSGYRGPLSAFRVELDDERETVAYVVEETGEVARSVWRNRMQSQFGHSLHVFDRPR